MNAEVKSLAALMDEAFGFFVRAYDLGERIKQAETVDEISDLVDERWRLSVLTGTRMGEIASIRERLESDPSVSPSDKAFLQEKRQRLHDLVPRFRTQDLELNRNLKRKLDNIRTELAGVKRNTHAIKQYISGPTVRKRY